MLRPLLSKMKLTSAIRSRFSRSGTLRYGNGSQRLPDSEKSGNTHRSSTLAGSNGGGGGSGNGTGNIYQGSKSARTWYNTAVSAMVSKNDDGGSDGSQEEMVPVGRIGVKQDVDWDTKDDASATTPPPPHAV